MNEKQEHINKSVRALNISDAAKYIGVSRGSLMTWIHAGLIPYEQLPGRGDGSHQFRLLRKSDIDMFLNKHYSDSKGDMSKNSRGMIFLSKTA